MDKQAVDLYNDYIHGDLIPEFRALLDEFQLPYSLHMYIMGKYPSTIGACR